MRECEKERWLDGRRDRQTDRQTETERQRDVVARNRDGISLLTSARAQTKDQWAHNEMSGQHGQAESDERERERQGERERES